MFDFFQDYLILYLLFINIISFLQMAWDKRQSKRGGWRIKEKNLFLTALLGGAIGAYGGMKFFRHKTRHNSFKYGLPILIVLNIGCIAILLGN